MRGRRCDDGDAAQPGDAGGDALRARRGSRVAALEPASSAASGRRAASVRRGTSGGSYARMARRPGRARGVSSGRAGRSAATRRRRTGARPRSAAPSSCATRAGRSPRADAEAAVLSQVRVEGQTMVARVAPVRLPDLEQREVEVTTRSHGLERVGRVVAAEPHGHAVREVQLDDRAAGLQGTDCAQVLLPREVRMLVDALHHASHHAGQPVPCPSRDRAKTPMESHGPVTDVPRRAPIARARVGSDTALCRPSAGHLARSRSESRQRRPPAPTSLAAPSG